MKVGTDALLLGIWVSINDAICILDVGTGTGILALLAAARSNAVIDAIELDEASIKEASQNFLHSSFNDRLHAFHDDFNHFAANSEKKYDLVISNPPFFINDMRSKEPIRNNARHGDSLSYRELCEGVGQILNPAGRFCLILPYDESKIFIEIAKKNELYVNRELVVFPKRGSQPNRICLELSLSESTEITSNKFIIREENSQFTEQYIHFFKDYLVGLE
jgi:tRNA1Val (adenine37-N6)-methyltransferase